MQEKNQARMLAKVVDQKDLPSLKDSLLAELKASGLSHDAQTPRRSLLEVERGGCSAMRHNSFVIGSRGQGRRPEARGVALRCRGPVLRSDGA